jgi:DNA-binding transcriptional LysR family regulator
MHTDILGSRQLRHFLTVYELGSIGQAAERLFLTQPALSKSIRMLEDHLGMRLFERTTRGVVATVYGEALALHARQIAAQIRHAEAQLSSLAGTGSGRVSIGGGPSTTTEFLPSATRRIVESGLDIELSVTEGLVDDLIPALRRGELDLAIGSWPVIAEPTFVTEVLATDRIRVVVREDHPLAGRPVEISDLLEYPWALPPSSQRWRQQLEEQFLTRGLNAPTPRAVSNSASYIKALLLQGEYLSFLPGLLVRGSGLAALDVELPAFSADITLTYKERSLRETTVRAVADILREVGAEFSNDDMNRRPKGRSSERKANAA